MLQPKSLLSRISIPLDLKRGLSDGAPFIFWPLALAWLISSLASSISDSILSAESLQQGFLKANYSVVNVRTTVNKSTRVPLDLDNLTRISRLVPETALAIYSESDLEFYSPSGGDANRMMNSAKVILVNNPFFQSVNGSIKQGRVFTDEEVGQHQPLALITKGLSQKLFGSEEVMPRSLFIQGREIQVVGQWEFMEDDLEENQALILPFTLLNLVADPDRTVVNKFILPERGAETFTKLKRAFDQFQLETGLEMARPNFQVISASASSRNALLWQLRRGPAEWIAIFAGIFALVCAGFGWDGLLRRNQFSLMWLNLARPAPFWRWWHLMKTFMIGLTLWTAIALIASFLLVRLFSARFQLDPTFSLPQFIPLVILSFGVLGLVGWINWKYVVDTRSPGRSLERK